MHDRLAFRFIRAFRRVSRPALFILGMLSALQAPPTASGEQDADCTSLRRLNLASLQDGDAVAPASVTRSAARRLAEREVCEVEGYSHPHSRFTLRIPMEKWNGRLLFQGCGGFCGSVYIDRANDALARGYATVATDMGHYSGVTDALWALDNPDAELDFAYRATHRVTLAAKAILSTYAKESELSIFRGCSTGGRQGIVAAQRYPEDYDAIISGAPVIDYVHGSGLQLMWSVMAADGRAGRGRLTEVDTRALADFIIERCDAVDGVEDRVIADPRACRVDWQQQPVCAPDGSHCLDDAAINAARAIYDGPPGGTLRGPEFGSELNWIGTYVATAAGDQAIYGEFIGDLFRYLAFNPDPGPGWEPAATDFDNYLSTSQAQHELFSGRPESIRDYWDREGKLLIYHGWRDQSVVPQTTLNFLAGLSETGRMRTRAFMIPGMNHCAGGVGPTAVDWLATMERWISSGEPPAAVTAHGGDGSVTERRIPHYRHP